MLPPSLLILVRKILENNFKKHKEIIKKYLTVDDNGLILDLGCGSGEFSVFF